MGLQLFTRCLAALAAFCGLGRLRFFDDRELDFLFDGIDAVDQHSQLLADAEDLARVLADDFARVLVVGVAVVDERVERDQAFDEEVGEFDEEAELGDADDEAVEVFADAVLHELHFLPFHQFALGVVGAAFGLAGFFGDVVEFFERDGAGERGA